METQYKFPPQLRPHQRAWKNRQASLQTTFNLSRSTSFPENRRLGPCLTSASTTGWIYYKSQDRVLHHLSKGWSSYRPLIIRQGRYITEASPKQKMNISSIPSRHPINKGRIHQTIHSKINRMTDSRNNPPSLPSPRQASCGFHHSRSSIPQ